jgi:very-short-patch-repair endonuclease
MFNSPLPLIAVLVLILAIVAVIKVFIKQKAQGEQTYPYEKEPALFSPAERSFLGVLEQVINNRYRLMGKIRLADIVKVKSGLNKSAWQNAFNKIQSKHIDIVACDPTTLSILFVIELDDKTHSQSKRQNRDQFVDNVLRAAGIPIVHFTAKNSYSLQEIENILSQAGVLVKS